MKRALPILAVAALILCACSTTRVLAPGEYRLARNTINIEEKTPGLSSGDLSSYVRQQTNGWSPLLYVYNWSDPAKDDWLNKSLRNVGIAPLVFSGSLVGSSRENIAKHLDYLGFYNSKVSSKIDTIGRRVKVTYNVVPGKRYVIDSIVYKVPEGEFADEFAADLNSTLVHKGDFLSESVLEKESVRGASTFRNRGYYDFSKYNYFFTADTLGSRNILTYEVREYTRNESPYSAEPLRKYHFGNVTIEHAANVKFRERVLKEVNVIRPGALYSEDLVNLSYNRLSALRIFNNVGIELTPVDTATVDCRITMTESKLQGFKLNLEGSTNSSGLLGVSPNVSFYHKNIFHGGEWLNLGFTGNFQWKPGTDTRSNEFGVTAGLSFPSFLGLPYSIFKGPSIPRTELTASMNYQNRPEFSRWIGNIAYSYSAVSGMFTYQVTPLRATVIKVESITDDFMMRVLKNRALWDSFYDHIDLGVGGQLYWTTNSSLVPKGAWSYARLGVDSSGGLISLFNKYLPEDEYGDKVIFGLDYSQYVRVALQLGHTFSLGPSTTLALRLDGGIGYAYGSSSSLPFEKSFYVGGASSMRGWQVRSLGPGNSEIIDFFTIPSQTGDWKLEIDAELRQKLFWKIEGALFAEMGNIWDLPLEGEIPDADGPGFAGWASTIAADWGLGLRLNLDFILLRLDWGVRLYDPSLDAGSRWCLAPGGWFGKNGSALHFGVGYPF